VTADGDELFYGPDGLGKAASDQLRFQVERARGEHVARRQAEAMARICHQGVNEYGDPVTFWTRPTDPEIGLWEAWHRGLLHREDGPATEHHSPDGPVKAWYLNGKRHREDGPAVEGIPDQPDEHYLLGERLTEAEWRQRVGHG
jgi:hypothetical protein